MTEREMERKLNQAVANATPDVFDRILSDCNKEERKNIAVYFSARNSAGSMGVS